VEDDCDVVAPGFCSGPVEDDGEEVTTDTEHYWENRQYCGTAGKMVGNYYSSCGPEVFSREAASEAGPVVLSLETDLGPCVGKAISGQFSCNNIGNSISPFDDSGVSANVPVVLSLAVGLGICDAIGDEVTLVIDEESLEDDVCPAIGGNYHSSGTPEDKDAEVVCEGPAVLLRGALGTTKSCKILGPAVLLRGASDECSTEGALVAEDPAYMKNVNSIACNLDESLPEPNNSNACSTVIQDSFNSRLLHSCSLSAFLKVIFFECARFFVVALLIYRLALI